MEELALDKNNYLVSICMITYNHENYVRQAIEGVLQQKTNFNFRLVIGDDCSKDNTLKIAKEYKELYPDKIKILEQSSNIGMMANFLLTLSHCNTEFIAICEGDDYWTSENKLQTQVNLLQENPEYSISAHNCEIYYEDTKTFEPFHQKPVREQLSQQDFIYGNYINTLSLVFRKNYTELPNWLLSSKLGDWPLIIILTQKGLVHFSNRIFGVYRIHATGVHQNARNWDLQKKLTSYENAMYVLDHFKQDLLKKYRIDFSVSYANYGLDKSLVLLKLHRPIDFFTSLLQIFISYPMGCLKTLWRRKICNNSIRNIYQ